MEFKDKEKNKYKANQEAALHFEDYTSNKNKLY